MANEISVTSTFSITNNNLSYSSSESFNADQSILGGPSNGTQQIGTSHETIGVTDITSLGWAVFKNLDNTNWIEVGVDVAAAFYPFLRLLPGETVVVRLSPAITLYAKANSTPSDLQSSVFEL